MAHEFIVPSPVWTTRKCLVGVLLAAAAVLLVHLLCLTLWFWNVFILSVPLLSLLLGLGYVALTIGFREFGPVAREVVFRPQCQDIFLRFPSQPEQQLGRLDGTVAFYVHTTKRISNGQVSRGLKPWHQLMMKLGATIYPLGETSGSFAVVEKEAQELLAGLGQKLSPDRQGYGMSPYEVLAVISSLLMTFWMGSTFELSVRWLNAWRQTL